MPSLHALRALAPAFLVVSLMAAGAPASAQTLTGAAAQKSPQADVFLLYENALIDGGLDAAAKHAAPSKVKENQEMLKAFGADGFKQMQAAKKAARLPEAERRKQIRKVEVKGDYAYLEAESERKGVLDVAGFEKTAEGWKVAPVRR
jgi:ketosteroid isomerase-like protein